MTKPLNYKSLLVRTTASTMLNNMLPTKHTKLPEEINGYHLKNELKRKGIVYFTIGIYENSKGEKVIVKKWSEHFKNLSYYSLKNEINMYKLFQKVREKNESKLPKELKNINTPKVIFSHEGKNELTAGFEFIDGKTLEKTSSEKKIKEYDKVIKYLDFISKNMSQKQRENVTTRTSMQEVMLFPALSLKALAYNWKQAKLIILGSKSFVANLKTFVKDSDYSLVHRDLHFDNLLVSGKTTYIIDFEFAVFGKVISDMAHTFIAIWPNKKLAKNIESKVENKHYFKSLIAKSVVHFLSEKDLASVKREKYTSLLKYSTTK